MTEKILVISDTHGRRDTLQRCIDVTHPFDMIIHCGDGVKDLRGADIPKCTIVLAVAGNTDIYSSVDEELLLTEIIEGKNVLITHGHQYNVKSGLYAILKAAGEFRADVVLFGHKALTYLSGDNPVLFNPGDFSTGNYGIISIQDKNRWKFEHRMIS